MKIIIDADASPVRKITITIAKRYNIECILVADINHDFNDEYATLVQVDQGFDTADHKIISLCEKNDIVITQDYGLAALVLSKNAFVLHHNGWAYTKETIDQLLFERHMNQKLRKVNKRLKAIPKRTKADNEKFQTLLIHLIEEQTL